MSKKQQSTVNKFLYILFSLFFITIASPALSLQASDIAELVQPPSTTEPVTVALIHENTTVKPGHPFWIAIHLKMESNWHCYWKNPGDVGMPIAIDWNLPEGFEVSAVEWPTPKRFDHGAIVGYGYEGEVVLVAKVTPPQETLNFDEAHIGASMSWLACSDTACLPGNAEISATIPVNKTAPEKHKAYANVIEMARERLPKSIKGSLTALRNSDLVHITLDSPEYFDQNHKVVFFPETLNHIDDHAEATVHKDDKRPGIYMVALKEHSSQEQQLKGILVLKDKTGKHILEALQVDLPIKNSVGIHDFEASKEIALNDLYQGRSVSSTAVSPESSLSYLFTILFYLVTAFAGGLILNLMPCVLPVISLKIMSFVKMSGQSRAQTFKHGLAFFFGVLVSFWVLATLLIMLQLYGHAVGWGFQMQDPTFIAILIIILLVFSLSMFGVMEVGTLFASWAGQSEVKVKGGGDTLYGSFFSGILATAVATPCTGPLLGPAVGFAVTQSPSLALLIFTFLGAGMAMPYLLLSAFPKLLKFIPKPGNWMITFRQLTGFIMLACVIWLLWVYSGQMLIPALFLLITSLFLIAVGCWVYGKWASPVRKKRVRMTGLAMGFIIFMMGSTLAYKTSSTEALRINLEDSSYNSGEIVADAWEPYNEERLEQLKKEGVPVIVDFTASWCLICQYNHGILSTGNVKEKLSQKGVVKMKADWTTRNPKITQALSKHGRNSVPLYLLYSGETDSEPEILPQMLTPGIVIDALETIKGTVPQENVS